MPELELNSTLAKDIKRFETFSDGYVSYYPGKDNILGDVRYSLTPNGTIPLWGIEMNIADPDKHVGYNFYRSASKATRRQFTDMLFNLD